MPAAAAVSGHARAVSSWLSLVERLGVGADANWPQPGTHPSVQKLKRWIRDWVELCGGPSSAAPPVPRRNAAGLLRVPHHRSSGNARLQLKAAPW
jgi:hypothetical protein